MPHSTFIGSGQPEELALAGWVTLEQVIIETGHDGEETQRDAGWGSILPGWYQEGEVVITEHPMVYNDAVVWPVGPGMSRRLRSWPSGVGRIAITASRKTSVVRTCVKCFEPA